ncbi:hypothetical protein FRC02_010495 [Tulasnella sp. 418]|nr:hypothetical protein FRC02_010495 [Tulasnella sp. 418]
MPNLSGGTSETTSGPGRQASSRKSKGRKHRQPSYHNAANTSKATAFTPSVSQKLAELKKHMGGASTSNQGGQPVASSSTAVVPQDQHVIPWAALKEKKGKMKENGKQDVQLPVFGWQKEANSDVQLFYATTIEESEKLVDRLAGSTVLGFDMEWRPVFQKNVPQRKVALIQLCDDKTILLLHVSAMHTIPSKLEGLLSNPSIVKVGVGISGDAQKLFQDYRVMMASTIDLDSLRRIVDPKSIETCKDAMGLVRLVDKYLSHSYRKNRKAQMSNWEHYPLSQAQKDYAANDTYAGKQIFNALAMLDIGRNIRLPGGVAVPDLSSSSESPAGELTLAPENLVNPILLTQEGIDTSPL